MDSLVKLIEAFTKVIVQLTIIRVTLVILLAFGAVVMTFVYENRNVIIPTLFKSDMLLIGSGVGAGIFTLGWIFNVMLSRVEKKNEEIHQVLCNRIEELNSIVSDYHDRETNALETLARTNRSDSNHE